VVFHFFALDSSNQCKVDNARESFVFSVHNPRNITDKKFSLTNPTHTIVCYSAYGPTFGGRLDVYVADGCTNHTTSYTHLGRSDANGTRVAGNQFFPGEYCFIVKDIELFQVSDEITGSHSIASRHHSLKVGRHVCPRKPICFHG
jgi:hypothetical protein